MTSPPNRGDAIAELDIPRLRMSQAVLEGADDRTLRRGPGHIEETSTPGEPGNIGIAGHRDTFFRALSGIRVGDDVVLSTAHGVFHYRVSSLGIVPPQDVSVLKATKVPTLTLVTCYPFWFLGPAPMRYVVHATQLDAT